MPSRSEQEILTVAGRDITISNPRKVLFPQAGYTKFDVAQYYLAVSVGALRAAGDRPNVLVRYPNGIDGEFFYQKRAPESRPDWIEVVERRANDGRHVADLMPRHAWHRIEIDAKLVRMIEIVSAHRMRMQLEAREIRHPQKRGRVPRHDFFGGPS